MPLSKRILFFCVAIAIFMELIRLIHRLWLYAGVIKMETGELMNLLVNNKYSINNYSDVNDTLLHSAFHYNGKRKIYFL